MKYLLFSILFFPLFSSSQSKKVTQKDVKNEVAKLASLIERKIPKQKVVNVSFAQNEITHERRYQLVSLYYSTTGKKFLFVGEFFDVGADGWGEKCSTPNYDGTGCDGMPYLFQDYFIEWNKERQETYLQNYFNELKKWQKILK